MKVEGQHHFKGSPAQIWDLFRDTEVMAAALPGTRKMEYLGDNKYEAVMNVRVGPVAGEFSGSLVISNEDYPKSYTMTVEGRGKPGFMKGSGDVILEDSGAEGTLMKYTGEVQVGGRLAAVGQRLIDTVSKSIISQAFDTLDAVLEERTAAAAEGREAVYQEASQSDYAAAVARGFLDQITSRPWISVLLAIVAVAVIAVIVLLILN
jgi:carbon monoxide dehydrogenase subunit G